MAQVYRETRQALIDMETMMGLNRLNSSIQERPEAPALELRGGEVEFRNVRFGFHEGHDILKGINFTVPAGKRVAIVGASGSGWVGVPCVCVLFVDWVFSAALSGRAFHGAV